MKTMVLMKRVPDLVEDLEVDDSGMALDEDCVSPKLNEFDDHALEEALCLKEAAALGSCTLSLWDRAGLRRSCNTPFFRVGVRVRIVPHCIAGSIRLSRCFNRIKRLNGLIAQLRACAILRDLLQPWNGHLCFRSHIA